MVLIDRNNCCGCGYCVSLCPKHAIKMVRDKKGFAYPVIDPSLCVECNLCRDKCAMANGFQPSNTTTERLSLKIKNDSILFKSSSGGAFYQIASEFIRQGWIVYGAVFDSATRTVRHIKTDSIEGLYPMMGSKYVQSDLDSIISDIKIELKEGKKVLFVGTPCQNAQISYISRGCSDNLFLVDLLCHGVPSPKLFENHLDFWEKKEKSKIVDYQFRTKQYGYEYNQAAFFENGTKISSIELKRLLKLYEFSMRECCYNCPYTSEKRFGDITIGDLWESYSLIGDYDHKGTSLVLVNSGKGKNAIEQAYKTCLIHRLPENSIRQNCLSKPVEWKPVFRTFWDDYEKFGYKFVLDKYGKSTFKSKVYQTLLRVLYKIRLDSFYLKIKAKLKK